MTLKQAITILSNFILIDGASQKEDILENALKIVVDAATSGKNLTRKTRNKTANKLKPLQKPRKN